ncbi:hypothetical protein DEO72_LG5g1997 [Vigna unguiculata]|uniref:Uncharacterized protein n=1 Tax=Vigna unguiculata TaxID=3917 RepID=A0A4D6LZA7_VIGUN|nr:hypothetical protein DEO72_LG5g1997 [Vigna unguiculata]
MTTPLMLVSLRMPCQQLVGATPNHRQHPLQCAPASAPTSIDGARVHRTRTNPCTRASRRGRHGCTIVFVQHHHDLQLRAPRATTILARERGPISSCSFI